MQFTLKQIRYFVAVADRGSITKATRTLNVSQPSISAAIGQLEDNFGIELFVRHHAKGLSLTPAGSRFHRAAKRLLLDADGLEQYVTDLVTELTGDLEVGCILTLAPLVMPAVIASFTERYPATGITCHELDHKALIEGLSAGRLDMAVTYDLTIPEVFAFLPIAEFLPYAIIPVGHRLRERGSAHLEELAAEPMILLDLPHTSEYFQAIFMRLGIRPNIVHRTPSPYMVRSLVANGLGYSLFNAPLKNDRAMDGKPLRRLTLNDDVPPLDLGIVTHRGHRLTRTASAFSDHLKDQKEF